MERFSNSEFTTKTQVMMQNRQDAQERGRQRLAEFRRKKYNTGVVDVPIPETTKTEVQHSWQHRNTTKPKDRFASLLDDDIDINLPVVSLPVSTVNSDIIDTHELTQLRMQLEDIKRKEKVHAQALEVENKSLKLTIQHQKDNISELMRERSQLAEVETTITLLNDEIGHLRSENSRLNTYSNGLKETLDSQGNKIAELMEDNCSLVNEVDTLSEELHLEEQKVAQLLKNNNTNQNNNPTTCTHETLLEQINTQFSQLYTSLEVNKKLSFRMRSALFELFGILKIDLNLKTNGNDNNDDEKKEDNKLAEEVWILCKDKIEFEKAFSSALARLAEDLNPVNCLINDAMFNFNTKKKGKAREQEDIRDELLAQKERAALLIQDKMKFAEKMNERMEEKETLINSLKTVLDQNATDQAELEQINKSLKAENSNLRHLVQQMGKKGGNISPVPGKISREPTEEIVGQHDLPGAISEFVSMTQSGDGSDEEKRKQLSMLTAFLVYLFPRWYERQQPQSHCIRRIEEQAEKKNNMSTGVLSLSASEIIDSSQIQVNELSELKQEDIKSSLLSAPIVADVLQNKNNNNNDDVLNVDSLNKMLPSHNSALTIDNMLLTQDSVKRIETTEDKLVTPSDVIF